MHDIPLHANEEQTVFNMVCEIPRWTNAKMEVSVVPGMKWTVIFRAPTDKALYLHTAHCD